MPSLRIALLAFAALLPTVSGQDAAPRPPKPLLGACFGPFRTGEAPGMVAPLPSTLAEDLATAARITDRIRTYGMSGGGWQVPELCESVELRCWPGAWLARDRAANDREIELLVRTANRHPETVETVMVGNEVLLRDDLPEAVLLEHIAAVKAAVEVPVSTAEPWKVWLKHPKLLAAVDVVTVHIYPYWDEIAVENATAYTLRKLDEVKAAAGGKPVVLGEFGWPAQGAVRGAAKPSRAAMLTYLGGILPALNEREQPYFVFEIWDEPWKSSHEGSVGPHWGLFTAEGRMKLPADFVLDLSAGVSSRPPRVFEPRKSGN